MKKLLLFLLLILISITSFGQYEYIIKYKSDLNPKEVIDILAYNKETHNRYYTDSNTIILSYTQILPENYFTKFIDTSIVHIISVSMHKLLVQSLPKAGGADCDQAQLLCNNQTLPGNSAGHGIQELNNNGGCLISGEHQSSWYYINIQTGGSLTMIIDPNNNDDYDFAIWGPFTDVTANANCPPITNPIRCSYAAGGGNTGLMTPYNGQTSSNGCGFFWSSPCYGLITTTNNPVDNSEGASGDKWVNSLNVNPGNIYILMIDNFSTSNSGYNLSWGGNSTLGCTPVVLPIELIEFKGYNDIGNILKWTTGSENNNDYFTIEQSDDGKVWRNLTTINSLGNSTIEQSYTTIAYNFKNIINYYRLSQTDINGSKEVFNIISIDNTVIEKEVIKIVNILGQEVDMNYSGLKFIMYSDYSTIKKY